MQRTWQMMQLELSNYYRANKTRRLPSQSTTIHKLKASIYDALMLICIYFSKWSPSQAGCLVICYCCDLIRCAQYAYNTIGDQRLYVTCQHQHQHNDFQTSNQPRHEQPRFYCCTQQSFISLNVASFMPCLERRTDKGLARPLQVRKQV